MNYLHLINRFWQLHEQHGFSACQCTLYFCLLNLANRMRWPERMEISDSQLAIRSRFSINALRSARETLRKTGLIAVEVVRQQTTYRLTSSPTSSPTSANGAEVTLYKKTKNEKQNGSTSFSKLQERLALVGSRYDTGF